MGLLAAGVIAAFAIALVALILAVGASTRVSRLEARGGPPVGISVGYVVPPEISNKIGLHGRDADRIALVLASANCEPCRLLLHDLSAVSIEGSLVIATGSQAQVDLLRLETDLDASWIADSDESLFNAFGVRSTPHVFVISGGTVAAQRLGATAAWLADTLVSLHQSSAPHAMS